MANDQDPCSVRSLAEFKRFLSLPGATLTGVQNDLIVNPEKLARFKSTRKIAKVQGNGVHISTGENLERYSWLPFGPAKSWRFTGHVAHKMIGRNTISYRLGLHK